MGGVRNAKLVTEKPLYPKFEPLTSTARGIEPRYIDLILKGKVSRDT